ncbi:MAG TPA: hypothetical protein VMW10_13030 [Alphaproteobacteria bacterium]|nr:hypothetical protein [Alphaproteobacteria bacterium]
MKFTNRFTAIALLTFGAIMFDKAEAFQIGCPSDLSNGEVVKSTGDFEFKGRYTGDVKIENEFKEASLSGQPGNRTFDLSCKYNNIELKTQVLSDSCRFVEAGIALDRCSKFPCTIDCEDFASKTK